MSLSAIVMEDAIGKFVQTRFDGFCANKRHVRGLLTWLVEASRRAFENEPKVTQLENVAILYGPAGTGKSTLANYINDFPHPDFPVTVDCQHIHVPSRYEETSESKQDVQEVRRLLSSVVSRGCRGIMQFVSAEHRQKEERPFYVVMDNLDAPVPSGGKHWSSGSQLVKLLSASRVPVILVCNDRRCSRVLPFTKKHVQSFAFVRPPIRHVAQFLANRLKAQRTNKTLHAHEKKTLMNMALDAAGDMRRALIQFRIFAPTPKASGLASLTTILNCDAYMHDTNSYRNTTLRETSPFALFESLFNMKRSVPSLLAQLERQSVGDVQFCNLLLFRNYLSVWVSGREAKGDARLDDLAQAADDLSVADTLQLSSGDVAGSFHLTPYRTVLGVLRPVRLTHATWRSHHYINTSNLSIDPSKKPFIPALQQWRQQRLVQRGYRPGLPHRHNTTALATSVLPALRVRGCAVDTKAFAEACGDDGCFDADLFKTLVVTPSRYYTRMLGNKPILTSQQCALLTRTLNAAKKENSTLIRKAPAVQAQPRRNRRKKRKRGTILTYLLPTTDTS